MREWLLSMTRSRVDPERTELSTNTGEGTNRSTDPPRRVDVSAGVARRTRRLMDLAVAAGWLTRRFHR